MVKMASAGLILLGAVVFAAPAGAAATADEEIAEIQKGLDLAKKDDCTGALAVLKATVEAPAFSQINDNVRYITQRVIAACAFDLADYPLALRASRQATANPAADKQDWFVRTVAAYETRDMDDTGASLMTLATHWPEAVDGINFWALYRIIDDVAGTAKGDATNKATLSALFAAGWRPSNEPPEDADNLWVRLARYHLEAGEIEQAKAVAAVVVDPDAVVKIRAATIFDPVVAADPARFDIDKAYSYAVTLLLARAKSDTDHLKPLNAAAHLLYDLDRQDEALALMEPALAAVKAGKKYPDADEQLNWLYDNHALILMASGRVDEAIAAMKEGTQSGENGANVSQTINLADFYYELGRPAEALQQLAGFDPKSASPYGVMAAEHARTCAYAQLPDKAALEKSLAFVRTHAADAPGVAISSLLCAARDDEAAALALRFLADPAKRDTILARLHDSIDEARAPKRPFYEALNARRKALAKRPEIIAAVARFGHILSLPTLN